MNNDKIALILAAGKGKRMKSDLPKVLHKLNGRYIVAYVIDSARKAGLNRQILIIGHQAEKVRESLSDKDVEFVLQEPQNGTGHAIMAAEPLLDGFDGDIVILCGDMPLVRTETITDLIAERHKLNAAAVVLTVALDDPGSFGRIVRNDKGLLKAIVEYRDASPEIKKIKEVNTGAYCFDWKELRPMLHKLDDKNAQKEYYLTDTISLLVNSGKTVRAFKASDPLEGMGINSTEDLGLLERLIAKKQD